MRTVVLGLCGVLVALTPRSADAHAFEDLFGTDARFKAMANAGTAIADGPAAAYFNPAGLSRLSGVHLNSGFELVIGDLFSQPLPVQEVANDPLAVVSAGLSAEIWPKRLFVGMMFSSSLGSQLAMVRTTPDTTPTFALYGDRIEVLSLLVGSAVRIVDSLSVGLGASILGGSQISLLLDFSALSDEEVEVKFTYDMRVAAGLVAGLSWEPLKHLRFGLAYRMALFHKLEVDNVTILDIMGVETEILMLFESVMWYTPQQVALGAAYRLWDRLDLSADLTWYDWSGYPGPFIQVSILDTPGGALLTQPASYDANFHDIVVPRFGVACLLGSRWVARAGYAFHPTPAPIPAERPNVLDSSKHVVTIGGGVEILRPPRWPISLRLDLFAGVHLHKTANRDLGPPLEWGGQLFNGGGTISLGI